MRTPFLTEATEAGMQSLVPGVRPITTRERLERLMTGPLASFRPQKPLDIGLFDEAARNQLEIFGPGGRVPERLPPEGG